MLMVSSCNERECIERAGGCAQMPLREMQIDRCLFEVPMSEQHLDGAQVGAGFEQMCGEAMSKSVGCSGLLTPARLADCRQACQTTLSVIGVSAV